jgi:hypothetical protein
MAWDVLLNTLTPSQTTVETYACLKTTYPSTFNFFAHLTEIVRVLARVCLICAPQKPCET